ncbi:hypothetical protein QTP81_07025 [Alteromonas sp. ASW11-36]|uniref:ABC transporter substrate-binding protein n=1 Tax=Alteromonas arenosi TaxID=3055817 RepID=A0ABT7SWE5_9ALTE|nr:hypothetical protein [Alteromonas sp. ASW11-36]MDM7860344.1 hypothetical protein [Alteromonas sp. ASW11-36]
MPKFVRFLVVFATASCWTLSSSAAEQDAYIIGVNDVYADSQSRAIIQRLFDDMYAPLRITPELRFYPSRRGLQLADRLETDAEAGRVLQVAEQYPNLVVVPAAMLHHPIHFFCIDANRCNRSQEHLFAIVGGFQAGKAYCDKFGLDCFFDQSLTFLKTALTNGAVDVLVGSPPTILNLFCQSALEQVYVRRESEMEIISYHLVNRLHNDKVPALQASIERMHREGGFDEFKRHINQLPVNCGIEIVELKRL